ncbi:uncharacterized protein LOC130361553 [Hyla sarda]|uniref:uncharacterized protein LOC130361553 n=1 Tax=Hyla sarda TaxID=327740 RepID=UPI0024C24887|nr:uncharacterized protein LOC130361553 [Hyla sarda]
MSEGSTARDLHAQSAMTDLMNKETVQSMIDESVARSVHSAVHSAVQSAVTVLQDSVSKSISMALSHPGPSPLARPCTPSDQYWSPVDSVSKLAKGFHIPKKATGKRHHLEDGNAPFKKISKGTSQEPKKSKFIDLSQPTSAVQRHAIPSAQEEDSSNRAQKAAMRRKPDSFIEVDSGDSSDSQEDGDEVSHQDDHFSEESGEVIDDDEAQDNVTFPDNDQSYFDPALIRHPRSGEWLPTPEIAKFISTRTFKSLDKNTRNKLKAECPRPSLPHNSNITPELDPILSKFLSKGNKNPKKGLDRSFRSCQDKLMDLLGPLSKMLDLAHSAVTNQTPLNSEVMLGWLQRATCIFGNANAALSAERKRSILIKIDPQLTNLATNDPQHPTEGMLFGEEFIHEMGKYVGLFSSINKAQTNIKKVFAQRVFGRAGKGRSRFPGRSNPSRRGSYQPNTSYAVQSANANPFFPYRARPWRPRGNRGVPRARTSSAS